MAKAKPAASKQLSPGMAAFAAAAAPQVLDAAEVTKTPAGFVEPTTAGTVQVNPPISDDAALASGRKKAEDDKAAKEAAKVKKAEEKVAKAAATKADKEAKDAERQKNKAERAARLAELAASGKAEGSMLALADRVKQGAYVKGTTGQLRSDDALARALDGISATDVVRIGLDMLKLEDNPYAALNIGQQSMNLRNRLRGAIKKEVVKISDIAEYVTRNSIHVVTAESVAKAKADREAKQAAAKADREAKAAAAAAAKPAETKPASTDEAEAAKNTGDIPAESTGGEDPAFGNLQEAVTA